MNAFTSGPWHVREAPYGWDIFTAFFADEPPQWIAAITLPLGAMTDRERLGMYPSREACAANAALIATAPRMREALETILKTVDASTNAYEIASAALALSSQDQGAGANG